MMSRGKEVKELREKMGMVFQQFNLFQNKSVLDNCTLGLRKVLKMPKQEAEEKAKYYLEKVGMTPQLLAKPAQLSGGQQQRVALARALVIEPSVLLFDEPLSNLDAKLRVQMRTVIKKLQRRLGITTIYVTHDQEEALTMSDTIVVMAQGKIQQIGTPEMIYNEPKNGFVADFIGESNIIDGVMLEDCRVIFNGREFECVDKGFGKNEPVDVVVRPEDIYMVEPDKGMLSGKVISTIFKGVHYEMMIQCGDYEWMVQDTNMYAPGSDVGLFIRPYDIHIMKKSDVPLYSDEIYEEEFPEEQEEEDE